MGCSAGIFPKAASVIWYQMFLEESVTFVRTLKVGVEIQTSKVIFSSQVALDFLYQSGIFKILQSMYRKVCRRLCRIGCAKLFLSSTWMSLLS
jgi:hypothetical protein